MMNNRPSEGERWAFFSHKVGQLSWTPRERGPNRHIGGPIPARLATASCRCPFQRITVHNRARAIFRCAPLYCDAMHGNRRAQNCLRITVGRTCAAPHGTGC
jgi:hypothetical protein